jgi:hypothetical protein
MCESNNIVNAIGYLEQTLDRRFDELNINLNKAIEKKSLSEHRVEALTRNRKAFKELTKLESFVDENIKTIYHDLLTESYKDKMKIVKSQIAEIKEILIGNR